MDYDEEYRCCNKVFVTYQGLRIHQEKVYKKLCGTQQHRPIDRVRDKTVSQEPNHSGTHTIAVHNIRGSISEKETKFSG